MRKKAIPLILVPCQLERVPKLKAATSITVIHAESLGIQYHAMPLHTKPVTALSKAKKKARTSTKGLSIKTVKYTLLNDWVL